MAFRAQLALVLSLSGCTFSVDYTGGNYACEPPDGECPGGTVCGKDGFCVPAGGGAVDAAGLPDAPAVPEADADTNRPDAGLLLADGGVPFTVSFGERPGSDVGGVTTDTDLNSNVPGDNNGGFTDVYVAFLGDGKRSSGLLRFDVSMIPPGTTVDSVTLALYTRGDALTVGQVVVLRVLEAWDEGDQTADPGVANFNQRKPGTSWLTGGAFPPMSSEASILAQFSADVQDAPYEVTLPAALVQGWVDTPGSNNGVLLFVTDQSADVSFDSSESSNAARRPELRVTLVP